MGWAKGLTVTVLRIEYPFFHGVYSMIRNNAQCLSHRFYGLHYT